MTTIGLLYLALGALGFFNAPLRAESRGFVRGQVDHTRMLRGLNFLPWLTAQNPSAHARNGEGSRFGVCAGGYPCLYWGGYCDAMSVIVARTPIDMRVREFAPPPEHLLANWIKFHQERQGWTARESQQGHLGDLADRQELPTYEFGFSLCEHEPAFGHLGINEGAEHGAGLMPTAPGNTYRFSRSDRGKRRAKRSCPLRKINRFFRRIQRITNRGLLGDIIKAAGGLQSNLWLYRIPPNPARAEGIGVSFGAGTRNWRP